MFAASSVLGPHVVLPALGAVAAIATVVFLVSVFRPKMPSFFQHLKGLNGTPEMQLMGKALASRVEEIGKASGHALLDGVIARVLPGAVPLVPAINRTVEAVERRAAAGAAPAKASPPRLASGKPASPAAAKLIALMERVDSNLRNATAKGENTPEVAALRQEVATIRKTLAQLSGTVKVQVDPASLTPPANKPS